MAKALSKSTTANKAQTVENKQKKISAIDFLKAYNANNKKIDVKLLSKFGLKEDKRIEISSNIHLTRDIFGNYSYNIKDWLDDIDGNPIKDNKKLIAKIIKLSDANKNRITSEELLEAGVFTDAATLRVGKNIHLDSLMGIKSYYSIDTDDGEKDLEGRWLDKYVTVGKVKDALIEFDYNKKMLLLKEVPLNKELEIYLKDHFVSVKKSSNSPQGEHDLVIGGDNPAGVGIELKLSRNLKGNHHEAIGQIDTYSKYFGSRLLVVIAGIKEDRREDSVLRVIAKAKQIGCDWMFL